MVDIDTMGCGTIGHSKTVMWVELTVAGRMPLSGPDQQETATFVLNDGHWIDAKLGSSHSMSEMESFLYGTLVQRILSISPCK